MGALILQYFQRTAGFAFMEHFETMSDSPMLLCLLSFFNFLFIS